MFSKQVVRSASVFLCGNSRPFASETPWESHMLSLELVLWPSWDTAPFPLMHSGNVSYCIPPKSQYRAPLTTAPAWLCKSPDATIRAHSWLFSCHREVPGPFWGVTNIDVSGDSWSQLFTDSIILKTKLHLLVFVSLVLSAPLLRRGF